MPSLQSNEPDAFKRWINPRKGSDNASLSDYECNDVRLTFEEIDATTAEYTTLDLELRVTAPEKIGDLQSRLWNIREIRAL